MRWGRRILGWVWVASVAVSTLLFVAAVTLGVRSYEIYDSFYRGASAQELRPQWSFGSRSGSLWITRELVHRDYMEHGEWRWNSRRADRFSIFAEGTRSGFAYADIGTATVQYEPILGGRGSVPIAVYSQTTLTLPHWFIALLSLPLPLIAIRRWRKKRRVAREGLCPVCGYDLRASVERCPECGNPIEARGVA